MTDDFDDDMGDDDDESLVFAKMDANLDSNPKIRAAGRDAREVYLFVIRRNRLKAGTGSISSSYIDPDYLAGMLMMPRDAAVTAVTAAVTHRLLSVNAETGTVAIVGWTPRWGMRKKSGQRRTKDWRARKAAEEQRNAIASPHGDEHVTPPASPKVTVTRVTVGEERRGDKKKRSADDSASVVGLREVTAKFFELYERAYGQKPGWAGREVTLVKSLLKRAGPDEVIRRMVVMFTGPPEWLSPPYDIATLSSQFNKLVQLSTPRAFGRSQPDRPAPALANLNAPNS
jgi:hypothetical protein